MNKNQNDCTHDYFIAEVQVGRITDNDEMGIVLYFNVGVRVRCQQCGTNLQFYGPQGINPNQAMVSADQFELRAPAFTEETHAMRELFTNNN